ncbi:MAG: response regulator [Spirochaetae bacterium HGW-Spirochaetae-1]|nr:MAG: response regulator [Spirochaetae bacterium HGW-Spirochaetae-1]
MSATGVPMKRILIIDDDEDIRTILQEVISLSGYEALTAEDGTEGIDMQRNKPFDLIITDIIMSGKEGIETILELKKEYADLKIIAMSGGGRISGADYLTVAGRIGADGTMAKPFNNKDLMALIKKIIGE